MGVGVGLSPEVPIGCLSSCQPRPAALLSSPLGTGNQGCPLSDSIIMGVPSGGGDWWFLELYKVGTYQILPNSPMCFTASPSNKRNEISLVVC